MTYTECDTRKGPVAAGPFNGGSRIFGRKVLSAAIIAAVAVAVAVAVAAIAGAGAGALHAEEVTLKAGTFAPPGAIHGVPLQICADRVNETGEGLVQIRIVGRPEAIPAAEQANAVMAGGLDIAAPPPSCCKCRFAEADAQSLTAAARRESGAIRALSDRATEAMGAFRLTCCGIDVPFHIFLAEEVPSLEDLRGLTAWTLIFDALGIDGAAIPAADICTASEPGAVRDHGRAPWGIGDFGWDKLTKTRVDPGFCNVIVNALMKKRNTMRRAPSAGRQAAPAEAAAWFEASMIDRWAERTAAEFAARKEAGVAVFDAGPEPKQMATGVCRQDLEALSPRISEQRRRRRNERRPAARGDRHAKRAGRRGTPGPFA